MATRCYFPEATAAPVAVTPPGGWTHDSGVRRALVLRTPGSSTLTTTAYTPDASDHIVAGASLMRQYVSEPLAAQTISGTLIGQFQCLEGDAGNNLGIAVRVYTVSTDGATVTHTLAALTQQVTEINTALRNQSYLSISLTSTTIAAGERLVVEIGIGGTPTATGGTQGHNGSMRWGETASSGDLPVDNTTTTTTFRPWIEFSADIVRQPITPATMSDTVTASETLRKAVTRATMPDTLASSDQLVTRRALLRLLAADAVALSDQLIHGPVIPYTPPAAFTQLTPLGVLSQLYGAFVPRGGPLLWSDDFVGSATALGPPNWAQWNASNLLSRDGAGRVYSPAANQDALVTWTQQPGVDQFSEVVVAFTGTGDFTKYIGLIVRASGVGLLGTVSYAFWSDGGADSAVYYYPPTGGAGRVALARYNAFTFAVGDAIRLSVQGSTLTVRKNGVVVPQFTVTDTTIAAAGFVGGGVWGAAPSTALESWQGGDYQAAPAAGPVALTQLAPYGVTMQPYGDMSGRPLGARVVVRLLQDSLTASDTLTRTLARLVQDSLTLSDAMLSYAFKPLPGPEGITLTDVLTHGPSGPVLRVLTDTLTLLDTLGKSLTRLLGDAVTLSDTLGKQVARRLTDTVTLSDSLSRTLGRPLVDTLSVSDALQPLLARARGLTDSVTASDTLAKQVQRTLRDSLTVTDGLSHPGGAAITLTDALTLSDTLRRNLALLRADSLTLSDQVLQARFKLLSGDTVTLTDGLLKTVLKPLLGDTLTLGDSLQSTTGVRTRLLSDALTLSDGLTRRVTYQRALSDILALGDSLLINGQPVQGPAPRHVEQLMRLDLQTPGRIALDYTVGPVLVTHDDP